MSQTQRQMVEDFARACGWEPPTSPRKLTADDFNMWESWMKIIEVMREEVEETDEAAADLDIAHVAHELADVLYTVRTAEVFLGIPLDDVFKVVHQANLTKIDPATGLVFRNDAGRVGKGPNYTKPDVAAVLHLCPHGQAPHNCIHCWIGS